MNGLTEFAFDGAMAFLGKDFAAAGLANVEGVDGSAFFSGNFGGGDIDVQLAEGLRDFVEQTDAVFGFDFDQGSSFGGVVIETDLSGNALTGIGVVSGAGDFLFQDERMEIDAFAAEGAVEDGFEFVALVGTGEVASSGVGNEESIENDAIGSGKDLGAKDVQAADTEGAGDVAEKAGTVPGADFDRVVAAIQFVVPIDDWNEGGFLFRNLLAHKAMGKQEIVEDIAGGMDLEIARRQSREMSLKLLVVDAFGQQMADFFKEDFALLFFGADEFSATGHQLSGPEMQRPKQLIFESIPELIAGRQRIGESMQGEQVQCFGIFNLARELADDSGIIEVAPLRDIRHEQMMLDEAEQGLGGGRFESEALGDAESEF